MPLSLYLHIPFCDSLCWFCGCHTKVTRRYAPLAAYVETLLREIDLVAARLPGRSPVTHIHWGGGSPTMLAPAGMRRIALFGYAHVPHIKRHQRLIREDALPGGEARLEQSQAAAERLQALGYRRIGLDHFALPRDPLARAAVSGGLYRNFQGYTTDRSDAPLGFGASAIGKLPQGYVQNAVPLGSYRRTIDQGGLAAVRGVAFRGEDRLRAAIIERIMCDLEVDLDRVSANLGTAFRPCATERTSLAELADDGVIEMAGPRLRVTGAGRPFVRQVAAAFVGYLHPGAARHSRAI